MDDHIFTDEKVLMYAPHTSDTYFVNIHREMKAAFEKLAEEFRKIGTAFDYTFTGSDGLIEKMESTKPVYDISWIRKRMKCCKNPMERKQLEKQLNVAYKARKKARNKR